MTSTDDAQHSPSYRESETGLQEEPQTSGYGALDSAVRPSTRERERGRPRKPERDQRYRTRSPSPYRAKFTRSAMLASTLGDADLMPSCSAAACGRLSQTGSPEPHEDELPTAWNDMSKDWIGMKKLAAEDAPVLIGIVVLVVPALVAIFTKAGAVVVFWLAFLGLLPLAMQLGDMTEILAHWCGPVAGGFINATLGNTMETIVMITALEHSLVGVEQAVLLGGVLSNMLLVLGTSFLVGGLTHLRPQYFDQRTTVADVGVLFCACLGVTLPTAFAVAHEASSKSEDPHHLRRGLHDPDVLHDSRGTAIVLLCMYPAYLFFKLWPAPALDPQINGSRFDRQVCRTCNNTYGYADVETPLLRGNGVGAGSAGAGGKGAGKALGGSRSPSGDSEAGSYHSHAEQAASGSHAATSHTTAPSKAKHKGPIVSAVFIVACITAITVLVAILTNALVTAIFPVSDKLNISPDFIAVVLLPVVGNAAELATATMAAQRDNLDLSIAVALGSATQISLFLVPASVLFGWAIDVPMTLDFQPTFALVFFGSVLAVAVLTVDGESHWLKGVVLLGVYGTMAVGMAAAPGAAGVDTSSQESFYGESKKKIASTNATMSTVARLMF